MVDARFYTSHAPFHVSDLIKGLPITVGGPVDCKLMITSASALAQSGPGDVTYLGGRKNLKTLAESAAAGACLTAPQFEDAVRAAGMLPLVTASARTQFALLLPRLFSPITADVTPDLLSKGSQISPCAVLMPNVFVAQNATIGKRSRIGLGAYIGPGVVIGDDCHIGANVSITCAIIGNSVSIGASSVIGQRGFGVTKDGETNVEILHLGRVVIGDDVTMGSHCAVDRGMLEDTVIGSGCKFDNFCQVAHNVKIGKNGLFAGFAGISGSCVIGDNVVMGGKVGLSDHVTIGDGAQIAGNAGVMKNVPPGDVWSGYPAKPLRTHMKEIATLSRLAKRTKKT